MSNAKVLLPIVPPHLLALIQKQVEEDEEASFVHQPITPMIDMLPLHVEPVGFGFFNYNKQSSSVEDNDEDGDTVDNHHHSSERMDANHQLMADLTSGDNHYIVLGFPSNVNPHQVTHLQIKKAYKKAAVKWHPDKLPNKDDTMFKKVNRAWEVLKDPKAKLYFDSSLPFDDSVPDYYEKEDANDPEKTIFFQVFQEAFDRWTTLTTAAKHIIPKLGNIHSSKKHVDQFYFFWSYSFKSWRDFGYLSEYDLSNAESRDERRWMERQNTKTNLAKKKEEKEQLKKLVAECKKYDVRVKRFAQEEAELREQQRVQKEQERRQKELERIQREDEEQKERERVEREKIEEQRRIREEEKKKKSDLQNLQTQFREICKDRATIVVGTQTKKKASSNAAVIQGEDVEYILLSVKDAAELKNVIDRFSDATGDKFVTMFNKCAEALRKREEKGKQEQAKLSQIKQLEKKQQQQQEATEWTPDEIVMLQKAIVKFPGGTIERWKRVAEFIGTRTADEVQKMTADVKKGKVELQKLKVQKTKEIHSTDNASEVDITHEWTKEEQKKFEDLIRKHKNLKGDDKWKAIADDLGNRTLQECAQRFDYCREMAKKKMAANKK
jgi:DnaJ family protein C protein 2